MSALGEDTKTLINMYATDAVALQLRAAGYHNIKVQRIAVDHRLVVAHQRGATEPVRIAVVTHTLGDEPVQPGNAIPEDQ